MGKKETAGKAAAKAAKAVKQQEKSGAKATKAAKKSGAVEADEESIEDMLRALSVADAARAAVSEEACAPPSARVNASVTPLPSGDVLIFGGERFDGSKNVCFGDLFRATPAAAAAGAAPAWTFRIVRSATAPLPRCSHVAVHLEASRELLVFGGEFTTANQFYHHGDTWRLDTASGAWAAAPSKRAPSPRSGHRAGPWRIGAVLFGGFFQTLTADKWFSDLWVYDPRVGGPGWVEVPPVAGAPAPAPRSGHGFAVLPGRDLAILCGGYSEVAGTRPADAVSVSKKGKVGGGGAGSLAAFLATRTHSFVHSDVWVLRLGGLAAIFEAAPGTPLPPSARPTWERVRVLGTPPSPRTGFSFVAHRDRVILFGGVTDADADDRGEAVASVFHSDVFSFDVGRRRWTELTPRTPPAHGMPRVHAIAASSAADEDAAAAAAAAAADRAEMDEALGAASSAPAEGAAAVAADATGRQIDDDAFYMLVDGKLVRLGAEAESETARIVRVSAETEAASALAHGLLPEGSIEGGASSNASGDAAADAAAAAVVAAEVDAPPLPLSTARPVGRLRAGAWVEGHFLTIWGGLREEARAGGRAAAATKRAPPAKALPVGAVEGDIEVSLDDVWRFDLRVGSHSWEEAVSGAWRQQLAAWRGDAESSEEEEESGESSSEEEDEEEEDEGSGGEGEEGSDAAAGGGRGRGGRGGGGGPAGGAGIPADAAARAIARTAAATPEAVRARELRATLLLEDAATTPTPEEDLKAFFGRTAAAWTRVLLSGFVSSLPRAADYDSGSDLEDVLDDVGRGGGGGGSGSEQRKPKRSARDREAAAAARLREGERLAGKEIRRRSFVLARLRFDEVWPTLADVLENEAAVREFEQQLKERAEEAAREGAARRARAEKKGGKRK